MVQARAEFIKGPRMLAWSAASPVSDSGSEKTKTGTTETGGFQRKLRSVASSCRPLPYFLHIPEERLSERPTHTYFLALFFQGRCLKRLRSPGWTIAGSGLSTTHFTTSQ